MCESPREEEGNGEASTNYNKIFFLLQHFPYSAKLTDVLSTSPPTKVIRSAILLSLHFTLPTKFTLLSPLHTNQTHSSTLASFPSPNNYILSFHNSRTSLSPSLSPYKVFWAYGGLLSFHHHHRTHEVSGSRASNFWEGMTGAKRRVL